MDDVIGVDDSDFVVAVSVDELQSDVVDAYDELIVVDVVVESMLE